MESPAMLMLRRTLLTLLVACMISVAAIVVLAIVGSRTLDTQNQCDNGFSLLIDCNYHSSTTTIGQSKPDPAFAARAAGTAPSITPVESRPGYFETTNWAVSYCPQTKIVRQQLCPSPTAAQASGDDTATGLPLPKPWLLRTARNSPFIASEHVETPLDLASVLAFYRTTLGKRGWVENGGAVVAPDRAVISFTTPDGLAGLRLMHADDKTTIDLSVRRPADINYAETVPAPGRTRLMLGNNTDDEAVVSVDEREIKLPADAKLRNSQPTDLPPGKIKVALKLPNGAVQTSEFEAGADETWGVLVGSKGVLLPVRLY